MEEAGELQAGCDGCGAGGGRGFGGQQWTLGLCRAVSSSAGPGSEHHGGLCDPEHGMVAGVGFAGEGRGDAGTAWGDPG